MLRCRFLLILFVLLGPVVVAAGQPRPPADLLARWLGSQAEAAGRVRNIEVIERTERAVGGPYGARRIVVEALVSGRPGQAAWRRHVRSMEADGREVPPPHRDRLDRHGREMLDRSTEPLRRSIFLPPSFYAGLRPVGPPAPDRVEGAAAWRLELRPPAGDRSRVARARLWLDQRRGTLLRSRIDLHPSRKYSAIAITTDFDRIGGLDLPVWRRVEGSTQMRRRVRTFTVEVDTETTYSRYRLAR